MAVELARKQLLPKPWGVAELGPWGQTGASGIQIGEIQFDRPGTPTGKSSLLLKLLLTDQPLSIQVHPDDAFAHAIGLPNGKTEAWYVLSAAPGAQVAHGLKQHVTQQELRKAARDGTIAELVAWRDVSAGDAIYIPAGTIHAIGAGLVIAEIQQRSDATYRLFDYGRPRELHIDRAIAVANTGPAVVQLQRSRLSDERTLLIANAHFAFERIELAPRSAWSLSAPRETWLLVVSGGASAGAFDIVTGEAIFAENDRVEIHAGEAGMTALVAYGGSAPVDLLRPLDATPGLPWIAAEPANENMETMQ